MFYIFYFSAVVWPEHTDRNSREMFLSTQALCRVTPSPSPMDMIEETAHTDEPEAELPALHNVHIYSVLAIMTQILNCRYMIFWNKNSFCSGPSRSHTSTILQMRTWAPSPPGHQPPPCHCWDSAITMFMRAHRLWRGSPLSSLMKKTKTGTIQRRKRVEPPHQSTSWQNALTWCWHQMAPHTPFPTATWTKTFWRSWCFLLMVSYSRCWNWFADYLHWESAKT